MHPALSSDAGHTAIALELPMVVELQDQLLAASTDLERMSVLLGDAAQQLLVGFAAAHAHVSEGLAAAGAGNGMPQSAGAASLQALEQDLHQAVMALQFQDMATQLITHAVRRVRGVADYLASRVDEDEADAAPVELVHRACPVAQRQMDAGTVELF
jgi:hypothetical protein